MTEKPTVIDIAKWFIKKDCDNPRNTFDGNTKLQKMLYFSQLIHLTREKTVLFDEPIYAYKNGAVVEEVRIQYKNNHYDFVQQAKQFHEDFPQDILDTLIITERIFCKLNARELSELNHLHRSWKLAYERSRDPETGFCDRRQYATISIKSIVNNDLDKINEMLNAYQLDSNNNQIFEVVNGTKFYYNPENFEMTDDILSQLEEFEGTESSYCIYLDKTVGLVVY